jgi:hypothetical protein
MSRESAQVIVAVAAMQLRTTIAVRRPLLRGLRVMSTMLARLESLLILYGHHLPD